MQKCPECNERLRIIDDDKVFDEKLVEKYNKCGNTELDEFKIMFGIN